MNCLYSWYILIPRRSRELIAAECCWNKLSKLLVYLFLCLLKTLFCFAHQCNELHSFGQKQKITIDFL